jgi:hypothetical protein
MLADTAFRTEQGINLTSQIMKGHSFSLVVALEVLENILPVM